jgi:hypothetical protein
MEVALLPPPPPEAGSAVLPIAVGGCPPDGIIPVVVLELSAIVYEAINTMTERESDIFITM